MSALKYDESVRSLIIATEIAINSFKIYPPKNWDDTAINDVISIYKEFKISIENAKPEYRNLKSLKYKIDDVFTYFQEGHGKCVEEFWKEIKLQNLPYKRENKMVKILKRKKINTIQEYDFVIDVIVPYQQEGLITDDDVVLLNELIGQFEMRKKK
ncbi:hypothetical protein [uncultured Flavobacterium sp.]|uniref:hypothetical protein n=1 Tax=uncultured Flavobacterium sp. TaxID=165435 RepID=UPI0029300822|nr:hypothetical protein [uncultured Flavobacterium sp.]